MNNNQLKLEYIKQLENENNLLKKRNLQLIKMMNELTFQTGIKHKLLLDELEKQKQHFSYQKIFNV